MTRQANKSGSEAAKTGPIELGEKALGQVAGGSQMEFEDVIITSVQTSADGAAAGLRTVPASLRRDL